MKKYLCDICGSGFKTEKGLENHEKRNPLIKSDYHDSVLKNKRKYFIFNDINQISRKHDKLYECYTLNKHCFLGNISGNVLKKSRIIFNSKKIENELEELRENECLKLSKYLKNKNLI